MRHLAGALLLAIAPMGAQAQVAPDLGADDPRLQTLLWQSSGHYRLTLYPDAGLTLMLVPGDRVQRATLSDPSAFEVRVIGANDSLAIAPLRPDAAASLQLETARGSYAFELGTGRGIMAAYLVRFIDPELPVATAAGATPDYPTAEQVLPMIGQYRLSGERVLRPSSITDDGYRTYIEWDAHQMLPAVLGIGSTGDEEVVDGYMRGGVFTIDRVYGELVFRIDRKRAKARRDNRASTG